MTLYISGKEDTRRIAPPKIERELRVRVEEMLARYPWEDLLREIARQHKQHDIAILIRDAKARVCPGCGSEVKATR